MPDIAHWEPMTLGIAAFAFMFACASLVRAPGVTSLLAIVGIFAVGGVILLDLHSTRFFIGCGAALVGIALGSQVSDRRERARLQRARDSRARRREPRGMGGPADLEGKTPRHRDDAGHRP
ncbi:MAG: hypothetical protein JNK22_10755 [Rhodocyclaceae bacterium]|nr:hypothetical protein [Rhodocyclaceae bacterium]